MAFAGRSRGVPSRFGRLLLVGLVLLIGGCARVGEPSGSAADVVEIDADGFHGTLLTTPYDVLDRPLRDTDGAPYSLVADTDRPITLVFFGYTQCPDICPLVVSSVASGLAKLPDDLRDEVDVVIVTTDPARDDARTLRRWLDRFDPSFIGLTGPLADIIDVAAPMKVYVARGAELPSGGYEVEHGTPVLGINAQDRVSIVWTEGTSPTQFADDIRALLT